MPGHVKMGKGEPDPDPLPYLVVTLEMKREDANKPYDPKKSYWCPDGKGGYLECLLESDEGGKAVVMCGHEVREIVFYIKCKFMTRHVGNYFRKRPSSLKRLAKSILPSLRSARTCLT